MGKHGEPWRWERTDLECYNPTTKKYDAPSKGAWLISPDGNKWETLHVSDEEMNHIVLCVNACAGMSDEEVDRYGEWMQKARKEGTQTHLQYMDTLKSQLDEAVRLLKRSYPWMAEVLQLGRTGANDKFVPGDVFAFISKHKDSKS